MGSGADLVRTSFFALSASLAALDRRASSAVLRNPTDAGIFSGYLMAAVDP
jgi:hypothetical protein